MHVLADIYLSFIKFIKQSETKLSFYTKTDLYKTKYIILPIPDVYFAIEEKNKITKRYFLDTFDPIASLKWLHKRTIQYFDYYDKEYWQKNTDKPFPEIIMVCPDEEYCPSLNRKSLPMVSHKFIVSEM